MTRFVLHCLLFDLDCGLIYRSATAGIDLFDDEIINEQRPNGNLQASDFIVDIREYDVPYHVRVCIDKGSVVLCSVD